MWSRYDLEHVGWLGDGYMLCLEHGPETPEGYDPHNDTGTMWPEWLRPLFRFETGQGDTSDTCDRCFSTIGHEVNEDA